MRVFIERDFEAAHSLPHLGPAHKCARLHGHSYGVRIEVQGRLNHETGMVMDYADIARAWDKLFPLLDHHNINDLPGLGYSTSENLAKWIYDHLRAELDGPGKRDAYVATVEVRETPRAGAIYP